MWCARCRSGRSSTTTYTLYATPREKCALDGRRSCSSWVRLRPSKSEVTSCAGDTPSPLCRVPVRGGRSAVREQPEPVQPWGGTFDQSSETVRAAAGPHFPVPRRSWSPGQIPLRHGTHTYTHTLWFHYVSVWNSHCPLLLFPLFLRNDWCLWTVPKTLSGSRKKNIPRKDKKRTRNRG